MLLLLCTSLSTATHQTKDENQHRLFPWMLLQRGARFLGFGHHWSHSRWSPSAGTRASQNEELFQTVGEYQPPVSAYSFTFHCRCSLQSTWAAGWGGSREASLCTDLLLHGQEPLYWLLCPGFAHTLVRAQECIFFLTLIFGCIGALHRHATAGLKAASQLQRYSDWGDALPCKL